MKSALRRVALVCISVALPAVLIVVSLAFAQSNQTAVLTRITTSSPGNRNNLFPAVSADGKRIAFVSDADFFAQSIPDDQFEIWLYDSTTLTLTRITTATSASAISEFPTISADGTKIVFDSNYDFINKALADTEIWLFDTTTMTFTRITTASSSGRISNLPSLSADGTRIAFRSTSDFLGQGSGLEIWLYDTTLMTYTRVTTSPSSGGNIYFPRLSADGKKVVFYSNRDFLGQGVSSFEIWLYDTETMTLTRVTTASQIGRDSSSPSLNVDGSKIAFHSDSDFFGQDILDGQYEIWLYNMTTMTLTRVTTASGLLRSSSVPYLNADGTKIVFHSDSDFLGQGIFNDQYEIWLYDTSTMTFTRVTMASTFNRDSTNPAISADGMKVAFESDSDFLSQGVPDQQFEIWLHRELPFSTYLPVVLKNNP